jgi:hypothetical protein
LPDLADEGFDRALLILSDSNVAVLVEVRPTADK